jgi:uncharacterized membrane protein YccC
MSRSPLNPALARVGRDGLAPDLARLPITHDLRAISLAEGARAALSVAVIIAANEYLDWPPLREAALGALLTCICDPGGPIGRRAPVLLGFTVLGTLITIGFGLARAVGPVVALPLGVLALFAASFMRVYGQPQQQLGGLLSTVIVLSLDRGLSPGESHILGAAFAGGALWSTLLTLLIWRVHPFLPARRAVARCYRALANLAGDLRALLREGVTDDALWEAHARAHRRAVRDAIEAARSAVLDTLRARGAGSPRAMQSLIRLETADGVFGALIALSDLLEHDPRIARDAAERLLRRLAPLLTVLAGIAVSDEPGSHPGIRRAVDRMEAEMMRLPEADPLRPIAARIVERLRVAQTLAVPENFYPGVDPDGRRLPLPGRLLRPLRANATWRSPALRHAVRTAVMAAPALAFTMLWFTPYDHWLTITIVATMQPYYAVTYARAIERIAGTALGGVVAAVVGLLCTTQLAIAAAMFPLTIAALAVRAVSLGMFMLALTPVIVLLVETGEPGASEWQIALVRAAFTTIGGLLAVLSSFVLWPSREPERVVEEVRGAIAAHGRYADAELGQLLGEVPVAAVERARREAGTASNSLEASISRALIEPGKLGRQALEAALVVDAALRRVAGRLSAMQLDAGLRSAIPAESLAAWRRWVSEATVSMAAGHAAIEPRPDAAATDALLRIARQLELIAGAMQRLG